jgi:predicted ATP-grasp superfamily ATP-dependent carboligase
VLLPCSDDWAQAVASLPADLAERFPCSISPAPVIETLVDKWRFAQLMESLRLPHPRTRLLASLEEIEQIPADALENAILKPLASVNFSSRFGVKGFLVSSREESLRRMRQLPFPIMLQEFVPGPPNAGYFLDGFVDRHGRICAMFARRRLRMHPPKLGNSTLMKSVPCSEVAGAVATLEYLLEQISYRGIFSAEFKFDARDGIFKLFEINARPWWYIEFPALCGVDVCEMAYRDAQESPVIPQMEYAIDRHCMFVLDDLRAWRLEHRAGTAGIVSWLRSWRKSQTTPFHWSDPLPGLSYALSQWKRPKRG